ncbi:MAG: HdeD family acid-resistance protein [Planctomycetota bacterium]|jgi:uncharacterized membrane protein HdeD (DUF308 family)
MTESGELVSQETAKIEKLRADLAQKWGWVLAFGGLILLSGLSAIGAPQLASYLLARLLGWLFLFAGISHLMSALYLRYAQPVSSIVIAGLLTTVAGLVMLLYPGLTLRMITLLLGCFLLAEAIFKSVGAFDLRPKPIWTWLLADGLITGILALLILGGWPSSSEAVVGMLVGISLAFTGVSVCSAAFFLKNAR